MSNFAPVIVRIPKRLVKRWVAKHERDGLDEWRLAYFVRDQYLLDSYERAGDDLLVFRLRFQRRHGRPLRATLWVRERKLSLEVTELILFRGHVAPIRKDAHEGS